jgi:hypothetical protein
MPDRKWRFGRYIESEKPVEHRRLAIIMPRREPAIRDFFAAVLHQTKPQQRSQDSRFHCVARPVPRSRKHRCLWDGAEPRQLLAGLPVIGAN